MSDNNVIAVAVDEVRVVATEALVRAGATKGDARIQAGMLADAELRAHSSHGLRRLPVLTARLRNGLIVSGLQPVHEWRGESTLFVDGLNGLGPVVAYGALEAIVARAATTGVAVAAIRRAHHLGMMAPYLERMTAYGCAGIVMTTSEALVHPWGGTRALVGTNPIGIGIPNGTEPLILDMSTGATSAGRIRDYAARGEALPEGWAVDAEGRPTTDAASAITGAISPFGGPKGYALGVALEALVGVLTGTAFGDAVTGTLDVEHPTTKGDLMIAFSLERFAFDGPSGLLADYAEQLRRSGPDGAGVDVPGDRARRSTARGLEHGLIIDAALWDDARRLAGVSA